ncbi:hypothetical protein [Leadbetterella sp. DM7]|uniref:hypothetical protein n=1 Tax=Leadbetterella sp. DM7 TaxID=3235085 RepID=UPI00349ED547
MRKEMNVLEKKVELIQWLSFLEDGEIIEKLVKFKEDSTKDWWDSISAEEKSGIEKGLKGADNNELISHTAFSNRQSPAKKKLAP